MQKILIAVFVLLIITITTSSVYSQSSVIKIKISGIEEIEGHVSIGLFNSPDGFAEKGKGLTGTRVKVKSNSVEYTFENLVDGDYAIAVFHDENDNEEIDTNFLGIPSEDYVFSNYARGSLGPPSFEDAKITLVGSVTIELDFQK